MNILIEAKRTVPILGIVLFFMGCTASKHAGRIELMLNNDFCMADTSLSTKEIQPNYFDQDSLMKEDTLLASLLSPKEIFALNATGMIPLMDHLINIYKDISKNRTTDLLIINARIQQQITTIKQQIDGLAAELDCEAERTGRAIGYLDNIAKKRNNKLTVGAIFAGTVATAAPLTIKNQAVQNGIVITTGIISTASGIAALSSGKKRVEFTYQRNLLSDIWYGPKQSDDYPPVIWFLLTHKVFNAANPELSIQQNLKKRWLNIEVGATPDKRLENLLFQKGGVFSQDDLTTREVLLKQLEATIRLLNQQIQTLSNTLNKVMGEFK